MKIFSGHQWRWSETVHIPGSTVLCNRTAACAVFMSRRCGETEHMKYDEASTQEVRRLLRQLCYNEVNKSLFCLLLQNFFPLCSPKKLLRGNQSFFPPNRVGGKESFSSVTWSTRPLSRWHLTISVCFISAVSDMDHMGSCPGRSPVIWPQQ